MRPVNSDKHHRSSSPSDDAPRSAQHTGRIVMLLAWALIVAGCGARTALIDKLADGGPSSDAAGFCPARLQPLGSARTILGEGGTRYGAGRIAVRNGGFDFLARRADPPLQAVARHGRVAGGVVSFTSGEVTLASGGSGLAVSVADERLFICHNRYNAEPLQWGAYREAYQRIRERQLFSSGALCTGLAYRGSRGMGAAHKKPPSGKGLSRPIVFDLDLDGKLTSSEQEALPAGDLAFTALTAYRDGFAWAGFAKSLASLLLTFRPDAGSERPTVRLPTSYAWSTTPELVSSSGGRVALAWKASDTTARVVVVGPDGRVQVEHTIARPDQRWVTGVSLVQTRCGLALAYSVCPHQGEGKGFVVLLDETGRVSDTFSFAACSSVRIAIRNDDLVAIWNVDGRLDGRVLRLRPR
jgi:hypothetical protein